MRLERHYGILEDVLEVKKKVWERSWHRYQSGIVLVVLGVGFEAGGRPGI